MGVLKTFLKSAGFKTMALKLLEWVVGQTKYKADDALLALVKAYMDEKDLKAPINDFVDAVQEDVNLELKEREQK